MFDQTRLMDLLAAKQGIGHNSDADCGTGIPQHVVQTRRIADPVCGHAGERRG